MNRHLFGALLLLCGCFNPDFSAKPCNDDLGCPSSYFCDTTRPSSGAVGSCSPSGVSSGDLTPARPPLVLPEHIVPGKVNFTLGSNKEDLLGSNDHPAYQRTVGDICVAETEVTVASYTLCVQAGRCTVPVGSDPKCNYGVGGRENHPINCVEFPQAQSFCAWINRRLPTESEWEYAANGATTSAGEKFPWAGMDGTFDAARACFDNGSTCPVGTKVRTYQGVEVAGAPGFFDLAGNVNEWTTSEPCPYSPPGNDLTCSSPGRVVRGGSGFDNDGRVLRSTVRLSHAKDRASVNAMFPSAWYWALGFRCFGRVNTNGDCVP